MTSSMTGYANRNGQGGGYAWSWDIRSVNGKGLDLRLRVPEWIEGLEPALRELLGKCLGRGNVSLTLRIASDEQVERMKVDDTALRQVLEAMARVENMADDLGLVLRDSSASDILLHKGVLVAVADEPDIAGLRARLLDDAAALTDDFQEMRAAEGMALREILLGQLDQVEAMVSDVHALGDARREKAAQSLRDALTRVMENADGMDPDRVTQELALIAVKTDVTEELDRLTAHIVAARELLDHTGPIGRKLDFLMQEFNREANTLCSKSQFAPLTRIGLDLKATIDQMREQVQNVE